MSGRNRSEPWFGLRRGGAPTFDEACHVFAMQRLDEWIAEGNTPKLITVTTATDDYAVLLGPGGAPIQRFGPPEVK